MAFPGLGYRTVWSMMLEIGFALVEPWLYTTTSSAVAAPGPATIQVPTLGYPVPAVYVGAQLVIDIGLSQEIVTVTAFNAASVPPTITATFSVPHASGVQLIGATFPTQAALGDQFYTQSEILSYIARAQNTFLTDVPMIYALNTQTVQVGQVLQPLVCDSVSIARIASSYQNIALASLTRSGGTVTAASISPHGMTVGEKFAILQAPDPGFNGAFTVGAIVDSTHWTYSQSGANESVSGGGYAGLWLRLLEVSQEELSMQDPFWRDRFITRLSSFYEDRVGLYTFGLNGQPSSNFPVEILCSIRDTDVLAMTDGFLVPDPMLHYVKYKALEFAWSKDGEQRSPQLQAYAKARYDRGVAISRRWTGWAGSMGGQSQQQIAGAGRK